MDNSGASIFICEREISKLANLLPKQFWKSVSGKFAAKIDLEISVWQICCQNSFGNQCLANFLPKQFVTNCWQLTNHRITNSLTADLRRAPKFPDFSNGFDSILLIPICYGITSRETLADCWDFSARDQLFEFEISFSSLRSAFQVWDQLFKFEISFSSSRSAFQVWDHPQIKSRLELILRSDFWVSRAETVDHLLSKVIAGSKEEEEEGQRVPSRWILIYADC